MLRPVMARYGVPLPDGATRLSIPGTLLISAISLIADVTRCVTMDLKQPQAPLYLVGQPTRRPHEPGRRPLFDPAIALETHRLVGRLIRDGLAASVHDVSDGGLLVAIAEMAMAGDRGCHVHGYDDWVWEDEELDRSPRLVGDEEADESQFYFGEMPALYVVEPRLERWDEFRRLVRTIPSLLMAHTLDDDPRHATVLKFEAPSVADAFVSVPLPELRAAWQVGA
jgi:phosphoribosylformylglycinamidine (FGAM) synthase-like enzyme